MSSGISIPYIIDKLKSGGFISANGRFQESLGYRSGWSNVDLMNKDGSQDYQIDSRLFQQVKELVELKEECFDIGNVQLTEYRLMIGVNND